MANLFLHFAFDQWMKVYHPSIRFERYADDIVVHCRSREQAEMIRARIEQRLAACGLALNPEKTRVVYCKGSRRTDNWLCQSFDFLGYQFRPRSVRDRQGVFFVSFSPAISPKASRELRQTIRRKWRLMSRTYLSLDELAHALNPIIAGWINYYGRFRRSALHSVLNHINLTLVRWAMRKYKRFRRRHIRAHAWLKQVAQRDPRLFVHWQYQSWMTRAV